MPQKLEKFIGSFRIPAVRGDTVESYPTDSTALYNIISGNQGHFSLTGDGRAFRIIEYFEMVVIKEGESPCPGRHGPYNIERIRYQGAWINQITQVVFHESQSFFRRRIGTVKDRIVVFVKQRSTVAGGENFQIIHYPLTLDEI